MIVYDHPNDVVLVSSVPTPTVALVSSESETYLGLLIMAAFWAFFSGAIVALTEREASRSKGCISLALPPSAWRSTIHL